MPEARACDLLAALAELCAGLESWPDPREGLRPCLRALAETLSLRGVAVWGTGTEDLTLLAQHGLPGSWAEAAARLKPDGPLAAAASGSRGVVILPGAPCLPPLPGAAGGGAGGAAAAAPVAAAAASLRVGTRTVGLLVALAETPEAFGEEVRGLLEAAATLLAGGLAFAQRLREANTRAQRLEDLTRVAQRLMALLDVESLPQAIAQEAARFLGAEAALCRLLEGEHLRLLAQTGGAEGPIAWRDLIRVGESLSGTVAAQGEPLAIADLAGEPRLLPSHREAVVRRGYRAYLGLPLHRSGRLVGILSLYATRIGAFGPEDVALGIGLSEQVALALEKADLLRRERQQGDRLRALHALSRAVAGSLDLQEILRQVVAAAVALTGDAVAALWVLESDGTLSLGASSGSSHPEVRRQTRFRVGEGIVGEVAERREVLLVADVQADPRFVNRELAEAEGLRASAGLPLLVGERCVGVLDLTRRSARAFSAEELAVLTSLADHAAIAIANARLYQEARRRAERLAAMASVARTLTASLEERAVFECIVRAAMDLLAGDMARLWVYDEDRGLVRVAAGAGVPDFPLPPRDTFAPGEGLVGTVFAERTLRVVVDPERDPLYAQQAWAAAAGVRAAAAVPVLMGERALGVLSVVFRKPPHLGVEELNLLTSFANQAAVAMENVRLYQHLKDYSAGLEEKVRERTAALEAANLQLTEANRLKSAFLANMSHELRTPLNSIIGFSEVLEDGTFGPLTERQRLYVQNILSSGRHLLSLITDILDLSKIEAGKMELRLGRFPLGQALAEAVEVIRGQALEKSITLTLEAEAGLPDLTGDAGKFRQICFNLLSNAVKFTPDGGRVRVRARGVSLEGPHGPVPAVEVTVADTGIGIEAADQERIFREFEQVDGSYAREYAGTGLGLALTRKLVEMHGGTIRVESAGPGRGSTFRVRLPLRPPVLEGDILVVDDDGELLQALTETFTRLGYGVRAAADGEEALAAVAAARPDCLILDLHLPRRSGLEVLRALREQAGTRGIPVVALTGWGEQEGREALRLGAREFLTKPVSPSVLAATVDRLVQAGVRERRR